MADIVERLQLYTADPTLANDYAEAMLEAAAEIARLRAELEAARKDAERLDWLDAQGMPVIEGRTISSPAGEHVANVWAIEWPALTVREAIDSEIAKG